MAETEMEGQTAVAEENGKENVVENGKEKETELTEKVISEAEELPKAIVRRVVKDKLSKLSTDSDVFVLRDSLQAFSESARIFIHYLSSTANDICKEANRQIINAEDVFKALEDIEFSDFIEPLRDFLEEFRQKNAIKKSASSKTKDTNSNGEGKSASSNEKDATSNGEGKLASSKEKDATSNGEGKSAPSKADDTKKKAKRKDPPAESEVKKKQRGGESSKAAKNTGDEDGESSD